jgi:hypothetical protein
MAPLNKKTVPVIAALSLLLPLLIYLIFERGLDLILPSNIFF